MFMVMVKLENLSKGYIVTLCLLIIIDYASKIIALNHIEALQQNDFLPLIDLSPRKDKTNTDEGA